MGLNGPLFRSLSGFRFHVSMWLGPPAIQSRMQLLGRVRAGAAALASRAPRRWTAGRAMALVARCPRKWRRDIPLGTTSGLGMASRPPSMVQDELVGVEQGPEHVLEDADRVGIGREELARRGLLARRGGTAQGGEEQVVHHVGKGR